MSGRLEGRRVLLTHADRYIGPPVVELFRGEGAHLIADESDYTEPDDFLAGQVIPISGG